MEYKYISWKDFEPVAIEKHLMPGKSKKSVCKNFVSLDTETSKTEDASIAWMYQFCLSYPVGDGSDDRYLVYGRRSSELAEVFKKIHEVNNLDENSKLLCFVHNLTYDYTYFHCMAEKVFEKRGSMLAVGSHKIISYNLEGLEFRDSLKIAQKSLDSWCKDLNTKHKKLKGTIDYNITRYQDTPLYKKDWKYMFYDVICLDEAIEKQMSIHNDHTWTIPLTNTGYVRRETRKAFRKNLRQNYSYFKKKELSTELFKLCRREFAGGLTHGNRNYQNMTVDIEDLKLKFGRDDIIIKHRDFASHYPSQQICGYCPSSRFALYYDSMTDDSEPCTIKELFSLYKEKNKCFLAVIMIENMRLKDDITLPVAQSSKFYDGKIDNIELDTDNGRIINMHGKSVVVVNELDLKWLVKQYKFDYKIIQVYYSLKGKFPKYITDTVNKFFYDKSYFKNELKKMEHNNISKDSTEYREMNLKMMIAKGMLNSIYGMTATSPVRISFFENDDGSWGKDMLTDESIDDKLDKYYNGRNNFMNYELGLWTTALARDELLSFVELIGYEYYLYCDTDSIFYISTPEIEEKIEEVNRRNREEDEKNGWFTEIEGKKIYYNQFEDEKEDIVKFKFLHSKCYSYLVRKKDEDGNIRYVLEATIAGVRQYGRNGKSRVSELGDIEELRTGKHFVDCGGTMIKYPPKDYDVTPKTININGHMTEVSQYAIIMESEKTLKGVIEKRECITEWEVDEIDTD